MSAVRKPAESSVADLDALAAHFDRTDAGDLPWDEAENIAIDRQELEQISLRLPKHDLAALRRRAARVGVGYTTLIRMIVRRYLQDPLAR